MKHIKTKDLLSALENGFPWPEELEQSKIYFRRQDDHDGNLGEGVSVSFGIDGDAYIETNSRPCSSCRYRVPLIGGGRSPRVRSALMILALAIEADNLNDPQNNLET